MVDTEATTCIYRVRSMTTAESLAKKRLDYNYPQLPIPPVSSAKRSNLCLNLLRKKMVREYERRGGRERV